MFKSGPRLGLAGPRTPLVVVFGLAFSLIAGSVRAESAGDGGDAKPPQDAAPAPDRSVGEVVKDVWTRDTLTGDWGGLRTDMHEHGIDAGLRLSQFFQSVASGGRDTNSEYGGIMDYRLNVDGQKLFGLWEGVSLQLHATTRFGEDVNADAGNLSLINAGMLYPAPGDYHDTKITHFTVTQNLFGGRAQAFAGKLNAVDLVTGFFPEQVAGGLEGFWGVQSLVTALPWFRFVNLSQWGGGAWTINEEAKMVEHGFIVIGQENTSTENFTKLKSSFDDGVAMFGWLRFFWKLDDLPGNFLVFAGGSTKKYQSTDPTDWHFIPGQGLQNDNDKKEPWDIAWYVTQDFWQADGDPSRHAGIFLGVTTGDDDPNFSQSNAFLTVEAFGPMASRPKDRMGVAAFYSSFADDYKDLTDDLGIELRDMWGFELYYNFEINKWLHLTPDLQLLENEWRGDDFAIIPGVRLVTDF